MTQQETKLNKFRVILRFVPRGSVIKLLYLIILSLVFFNVLADEVNAARLYFEPQEKIAGTDGEFAVALNIDAAKPINAVATAIFIPKNFTPYDTNDGNSIINLWIDKPHWDEASRLLTFSGIIPGGFSGKNARLLVVIFKINQAGIAQLAFDKDKTEVYLNTPDGIKDELILEEKDITITAGKENLPLNLPDTDAPESFTAQISQDPNLFAGQWFLVFATQDKGDGLARYEVCETNRVHQDKSSGQTAPFDKSCWQESTSPYLLNDQDLDKHILVKAVDKKGNFRMAALPPAKPLPWYENDLIYVIIIIVVSAIIAYKIWRNSRRKKYTKIP